MRRNPELLILAGLLVAAIAGVLWYVADRRAKLRATPSSTVVQSPGPESSLGPVAPSAPVPTPAVPQPASATAATAPKSDEPVDLTKHERQTLDFSSGQPVVKNAAEDKAAIDAAMKDIESAEKETTFEATRKDAAPRK